MKLFDGKRKITLNSEIILPNEESLRLLVT